MNRIWTFTAMARADADAVLAWHYEEPYTFYDMASDPADVAEFTNPTFWRIRDLSELDVVLAVNDEESKLAGFFSFAGSPALCTIGLGLAPELTGRSLGVDFVRAGLAFAEKQWGVTKFRLEVAAFNARAIKVYERIGFTPTRRFVRELTGTFYEFVEMTTDEASP